jgi:hypothetical protein
MSRNDYTITEIPNPRSQDSRQLLQEIANILHGSGTEDEKVEQIGELVR